MVAKAVGTVIDPQIQKAALPSTLLHNHFADTKTTAINHVPVRREHRPVSLCFFLPAGLSFHTASGSRIDYWFITEVGLRKGARGQPTPSNNLCFPLIWTPPSPPIFLRQNQHVPRRMQLIAMGFRRSVPKGLFRMQMRSACLGSAWLLACVVIQFFRQAERKQNVKRLCRNRPDMSPETPSPTPSTYTPLTSSADAAD